MVSAVVEMNYKNSVRILIDLLSYLHCGLSSGKFLRKCNSIVLLEEKVKHKRLLLMIYCTAITFKYYWKNCNFNTSLSNGGFSLIHRRSL